MCGLSHARAIFPSVQSHTNREPEYEGVRTPRIRFEADTSRVRPCLMAPPRHRHCLHTSKRTLKCSKQRERVKRRTRAGLLGGYPLSCDKEPERTWCRRHVHGQYGRQPATPGHTSGQPIIMGRSSMDILPASQGRARKRAGAKVRLYLGIPCCSHGECGWPDFRLFAARTAAPIFCQSREKPWSRTNHPRSRPLGCDERVDPTASVVWDGILWCKESGNCRRIA